MIISHLLSLSRVHNMSPRIQIPSACWSPRDLSLTCPSCCHNAGGLVPLPLSLAGVTWISNFKRRSPGGGVMNARRSWSFMHYCCSASEAPPNAEFYKKQAWKSCFVKLYSVPDCTVTVLWLTRAVQSRQAGNRTPLYTIENKHLVSNLFEKIDRLNSFLRSLSVCKCTLSICLICTTPFSIYVLKR